MSVFFAKYRKHFELCEQLLSLALEALPTVPRKPQTYEEVITAFFIKAVNSFRSIIVLCKEGQGDDAGLLLRSLLNLAFLVKWVEKEKNDRPKLLLGWYWREKIRNQEELKEAVPTSWKEEWERSKGLFGTDEEIRKRRNWYGNQTIYQLAGEVKEEDETPPSGYDSQAQFHYAEAYRPLSHIEHSNPLALGAFLERSKGHYLVSYLVSDKLVAEDLLLAFEYFFIVLSVWNSSFQMIDQNGLETFHKESQSYFQRYREEQAERMKKLSQITEGG